MSTLQDPRASPSDELPEHAGTELAQWWDAVLRRTRGALTRADVWALRVTALHLVPVAALVVSGGLYIDDIRAQVYASGRSWWPFVIESNRTHLAPSARTVDWLQATFAPLHHGPAVVLTLTIHAALGVAFWWVLREMRAARVAAVPLLALALLQPGVVPATAWYRQALTTLTGLVVVLLVVALVLRAERTGTWRATALLVPVLVAVGAGFSERTLAATPLAVALLVVRAASRPATTSARPTLSVLRRVGWRTAAPAIAGALVASTAFALAYRSDEYAHGGAAGIDWLNYPRLIAYSLTRDVVPALAGGPWRWRNVDESYALADPPSVLPVLTTLVVIIVLVTLVSRRRTRGRTVSSLLAFLSYALPVWFLLFLGRFAVGPMDAADDLRLWPDVGTVLLLCVAIGVCARRPTTATPEHDARTPHRWVTRSRVLLGGLAGLLVVAGATTSWFGFAQRWSRNHATTYVDSLIRTLPTTTGVVLPSSVPPGVVPGWVQADLTTTELVRLLDPTRVSHVVDGPALVVDGDGRVRGARLTVRGRATAPPGTGFCGFSRPVTATGWLHVPFDQAVPYHRASLVRIPMLLDDTSSVRVRVVNRDNSDVVDLGLIATDLPRGPHVLVALLPHGTPVSAVQVAAETDGPWCVPSAEVVNAEPDR